MLVAAPEAAGIVVLRRGLLLLAKLGLLLLLPVVLLVLLMMLLLPPETASCQSVLALSQSRQQPGRIPRRQWLRVSRAAGEGGSGRGQRRSSR